VIQSSRFSASAIGGLMAAVLHEWRIGEPVKVSKPSVDSHVDIVQLYSDKVMVHDRTINGEATQKSQARLSTSAEFATRDAAKARLRADRLRYSRSTAFVALA
jgi:hypothetical protein